VILLSKVELLLFDELVLSDTHPRANYDIKALLLIGNILFHTK
jgi:hypothetical protein